MQRELLTNGNYFKRTDDGEEQYGLEMKKEKGKEKPSQEQTKVQSTKKSSTLLNISMMS